MKPTTYQVIHHPLGWALTREDVLEPQRNRVLSIHPTEAEALLTGERIGELLEIPYSRDDSKVSSGFGSSPIGFF